MVGTVVGDDFHAKRVQSLANGVIGCLHAATLGVFAIGQGLASARDLNPKHATKQIDRMLSNPALALTDLLRRFIKFRLSTVTDLRVAMDWTDFEKEDHTTLVISQISRNGRTKPLYWQTFSKSGLTGKRTETEKQCLSDFKSLLPENIQRVLIAADRGFGSVEILHHIASLGFFGVIRIRNNVFVTDEKGVTKKAADWAAKGGLARKIKNASITEQAHNVACVVVKHAKGMKEPWVLASNDPKISATEAIAFYSRRFTIEEMFRDQKDPHFGMGLLNCALKNPARRDRMLFMAAMTQLILTLLGCAGEAIGIYKYFKVNTSPRRQHSHFRQGIMYYNALPRMRPERLLPLMAKFEEFLGENGVSRPIFVPFK